MLERPVRSLILSLAAPSILANVVNTLYNLADGVQTVRDHYDSLSAHQLGNRLLYGHLVDGVQRAGGLDYPDKFPAHRVCPPSRDGLVGK